MCIDLFGKKSKAKAEQLAKENAALTEKLINYETQLEKDISEINSLQSIVTANECKIGKLTEELSDARSNESFFSSKIDEIHTKTVECISKFTREVAYDYPNITNGKLRAFVDSYVILNVDAGKKSPVKPEHWFALETISRLQEFIDKNGLTVRKK